MTHGYALSPELRHYWKLFEKTPNNARTIIRIQGSLHQDALKLALENVASRHEILRTHLALPENMIMPLQVIADEVPIHWFNSVTMVSERTDYSGLKDSHIKEQANVLFQKMHGSQIDSPAIQAQLIQVVAPDSEQNEYYLLLMLSGFQADTQTLYNLTAELAALYEQNLYGQSTLPLVSEPEQYVDIAEWQNEVMQSPDGETGKQYWRNLNFYEAAHTPIYPLHKRIPEQSKPDSTQFDFSIAEPQLLLSLQNLAQQYEISLPHLLFTAWQVLLYRLDKRSDLVLGYAQNGRDQEMASLMGLMTKTLPIKVNIKDELTFLQLLQQNKRSFDALETWQYCFDWQELGLNIDKHVDKNQETKTEHTPYYLPFAFEYSCSHAIHARENRFECIMPDAKFDTSDLRLSIIEDSANQTLSCRFTFDNNRISASVVQRLSGQFQALLEHLVSEPELTIGKLNILPKEQRDYLLYGVNSNRKDFLSDSPFYDSSHANDYLEHLCVHHLIDEQAQRYPQAIAIEFNGEQLTYAALQQRSNQLAHFLLDKGVQQEQIVGVLLNRSIDVLVSILAIFKAGATYMPVDVSYPEDRIHYMLDNSEAAVVISRSEFSSKVADRAIQSLELDGVNWNDFPDSAPEQTINTHQNAYVIYTSGSTGKPKGTLIPHRALLNHCLGIQDLYQFTPDDRVLLFVPFNFDPSLEQSIPTLMSGATVVMKGDETWPLADVSRIIAEQKLSVISFTPAYWHLLVQSWVGQLPREDIAHLRLISVGGDKLHPELVQQWMDFGLEHIRLLNSYGPTETTITPCIAELNTCPWQQYGIVSIGKHLPNRNAYVLDEYQQPVPFGCAGELHMGGESIASGYHKQPMLTAEKFISDPFCGDPQGKMYRTGDRVFMSEEGDFYFLGRVDEQIKIRGYRIEMGEIEKAIYQHPDIQEAAVAAMRINDKDLDKQLVAFYVSKSGQDLKRELQALAQNALPEFMRPSLWGQLSALPLLPNGKLDRKQLTLDLITANAEAENQAPETPEEKRLAAIWQELFGIEQVGTQQQFFELGGHSLLAIRLAASVRQAFEVELSIKDIYNAENMAQMAAMIASKQVPSKQGQSETGATPSESDIRALDSKTAPLSFSQERLWLLNELGFGTQYHMYGVLQLPQAIIQEEGFEPELLQQALNQLIARHASLRTVFEEAKKKEPEHEQEQTSSAFVQQRVLDQLDVALGYVELRAEQDSFDEYIRHWIEQPFDLSQAPLIRATLIKTSDDDLRFALCMHHIIADAWSVSMLLKELSQIYQALKNDNTIELPEIARQYTQFAHWQRETFSNDIVGRESAYWLSQLDGYQNFDGFSDFPRKVVLPGEPAPAGKLVRTHLNAETLNAWKGVCSQQKITLNTLLMSSVYILLSRYANQTDFCLGMPVAGRQEAAWQDVVGCFINVLPIRIKTGLHNHNVKQFMDAVQQVILAAQEHQSFPFEKLVEELQPERDLSRNPVFQVMVNHINAVQSLSIVGHKATIVDLEYVAANFDLSMDFIEHSDNSLELSITYRTDLYRDSSIQQLMSHWLYLIEQMLQAPDAMTNSLELLSDEEKQQVLLDWNQPDIFEPESKTKQNRSLLQHIADNARLYPQNTALVCGANQVSYQELEQQVDQLAAHILKQEQANGLMGVYLDRSIEMVVAMLAIWKAGATYVPLDPEFPASRLQYMVEDAQLSCIVSHSALHASNDFSNAHVINIDAVLKQKEPIELPIPALNHNDLAYVIYTSGSTGQPKGVAIEHGALINFLNGASQRVGIDKNSYCLAVTTMAFDIAGLELFAPLMQGGKVYIASVEQTRDGEQLGDILNQQPISLMQATPATWQMLLDSPWQPRSDLNSMTILCGGEALPKGLAQRLTERFGRVFNCYGPTEATIWSHMDEVHFCDDAVTICGLLPGYQQYVVEPDTLQLQPDGVVGELLLGGDSLAQGYWGKPALTEKQFITAPFSVNNQPPRLYRTGDLVRRINDGSLAFVGRSDQQVKIRGYRIELGEIEAQLAAIKHNQDAVVVAQADNKGNQYLVAFLVLSHFASDSVKAELIREYKAVLSESLPAYMVPEHYVFLDKLPLTPNGKVDRKALQNREKRDLYSLQTLESHYVAPRNKQEAALCAIWQQVLNVPKVGIEDNFFALGGHSILASQLASQVRAQLSINLTMRQLFEYPTIAQLMQQHEQSASSLLSQELPELLPANRELPLSLSYAQQRMWFIDQFGKGSVQYNMPAAFSLKGEVRVEALKRSLLALIQRHEILRTGFITGRRDVEQYVRQAFDLPFVERDLSSETDSSTEFKDNNHRNKLEALVEEEILREFDLLNELPIRFLLLKLSSNEYVAVLTLHHIAADGWSLEVLLREFNQLYAQGLGKDPASLAQLSQLADLPIQYADYAQWQKQWLNDEYLQADIQYWQQQLKGLPQIHSLPLDYPRPAQQSFHGDALVQQIRAEQLQGIHSLCQQHETTLFMFLQSVFAVLLSRFSNESDIVIGAPIAGRQNAQLEQLVGYFANTLVLRSHVDGETSFAALLHANKQMILNAYTHQELPFEMLVDKLNPERSMSHSPLFQVVLVLQNHAQEALQLPGIESELMSMNSPLVRFDLELVVEEPSTHNNGLTLSWRYNRDLFARESIERMSDAFATLLEGAIHQPESPVSQLPLLSAAEREQLLSLATCQPANSENPDHKICMHTWFEQQVQANPDSIALVMPDENGSEVVLGDVSNTAQKLTYRELNQKSNQLAHYLLEQGIQANDLVGICVERSAEMLIAILAVLKAGAAYIPLDPDYPPDRLAFMMQDSQARLLLCQAHLHNLLSSTSSDIMPIILDAQDMKEELQSYPDTNPELTLGSDNLMYVIYTSGSTGTPKGVLVEHGNVSRLFTSSESLFQFDRQDVWSLFHSFAFDFSIWEMWGALAYGGKLVIVPKATARDTRAFAQLLLQQQVTMLSQIPTAFYGLSRELANLNISADINSNIKAPIAHHVRTVVFGGEALDYSQLSLWYSMYGDDHTQLVNMYGITETTVHVTYKAISSADINRYTSNIGLPLPDLSVFVCDRHLQLLPQGVAGELLVSGDGVTRGYLNRPELTASRFVHTDFASGTLYRTGDLVRINQQGNLEYLGRIDHQEKVRGFRMELGEIEFQLSRLEQINEAVVLAKANTDSRYSSDKQLVAYITSSITSPINVSEKEGMRNQLISEIKSSLQEVLPEYMIPAVYVMLDAMPLTPSGKIDRKALPEVGDQDRQQQEYVAPSNTIERILCDVWQELLHVEKIGVHDNFFALGGDSIRALSVVASAEKRDVYFSVTDLFKTPTIYELAHAIGQLQVINESMITSDEDLLSQIEGLSEEEVAAMLDTLDTLVEQDEEDNV
ncbi:amino acid adenylation domain-containing protein [Paraneptunicella aestuarii]|uniref:non-ribosomal peptide synthetase n=1 Tax=Paraneptunicella aestuarii TaxID=2831148 RepID=UPI001E534ADE|nr:non-ribosomal peptide synthetase [Paraneptunicella aestuarii]UAA40606.1 amino acid adenylation domain-containing protein [Paraneptunicella aestuarii]